MQVIYATKSMLNAGALEDELEDKRIANMEANSNDIDKKLNFHHACFIAYIDATYNPIVSQDKASFGVFLGDESRNHSSYC